MPVALGGLAPGKQGVNEKTFAHGSTVTSNTEAVVGQIRVPAGSLKVGTMIEFVLVESTAGTSSTRTPRLRIGSAGTTSDASVSQFSTAPASSNGMCIWHGFASITAIGASAAHIGNAAFDNSAGNAGASNNTSATSTFNSTNANWISVTLQNGTSSTTTIRGGYLRIINP